MFEKKSDKNTPTNVTESFIKPSKLDAKVHIGHGVVIKGEITEADEVQVDGQADITLETNNLMVGGTGNVKGNITSNNFLCLI